MASRIDLSTLSSPGAFFGSIHPGLPSVQSIASVDGLAVLALFVAVLPFTILWELRMYKIKKFDSTIPEFLKRLASVNESGLTLAQAVKSLIRSNLGVLNVEVKKMVKDMEWGADIKEALVRFEYRVSTPSISRTVTLITEASESTGDIKETLEIAGSDAGATQSLQEERSTNMLLYVLIIYISFFVFLYIIYTLVAVFIPVLPNVPMDASMQSMNSMGMSFNGVDSGTLKILFYHAVLIEGFFSGIIAGMMGAGNMYSGLKHALIMVLIGVLVFAVFI
jgi:flagellar protein FlaJ